MLIAASFPLADEPSSWPARPAVATRMDSMSERLPALREAILVVLPDFRCFDPMLPASDPSGVDLAECRLEAADEDGGTGRASDLRRLKLLVIIQAAMDPCRLLLPLQRSSPTLRELTLQWECDRSQSAPLPYQCKDARLGCECASLRRLHLLWKHLMPSHALPDLTHQPDSIPDFLRARRQPPSASPPPHPDSGGSCQVGSRRRRRTTSTQWRMEPFLLRHLRLPSPLQLVLRLQLHLHPLPAAGVSAERCRLFETPSPPSSRSAPRQPRRIDSPERRSCGRLRKKATSRASRSIFIPSVTSRSPFDRWRFGWRTSTCRAITSWYHMVGNCEG
jgi:hypothetical protein